MVLRRGFSQRRGGPGDRKQTPRVGREMDGRGDGNGRIGSSDCVVMVSI